MGIDIGCAIVVGLPADDLELEDDVDLYDFIEDNGLEYTSPWYDSGVSQGVVGYFVADTGRYNDYDLTTLNDNIHKAMTKFVELTGQQPRLYLSNHVT